MKRTNGVKSEGLQFLESIVKDVRNIERRQTDNEVDPTLLREDLQHALKLIKRDLKPAKKQPVFRPSKRGAVTGSQHIDNAIAIAMCLRSHEGYARLRSALGGEMATYSYVNELAYWLSLWESAHPEGYEHPGGKDFGEVAESIADVAVSHQSAGQAEEVVKLALDRCGNY